MHLEIEVSKKKTKKEDNSPLEMTFMRFCIPFPF